jgi:hypothetical protein
VRPSNKPGINVEIARFFAIYNEALQMVTQWLINGCKVASHNTDTIIMFCVRYLRSLTRWP